MSHESPNAITASALGALAQGAHPPIVIDVRRNERWREAPDLIRGALRRDPQRVAEWSKALPEKAEVVVYCVHGHEASQQAARTLISQGFAASFLEGGVEQWKERQQPMAQKPVGASTRWVTRERPKIDRIACPWLVRRFVDPEAEFLYVPSPEVRSVAKDKQAVPYDIPDVEFSHEGDFCSFDAFLRLYRLQDPALDELALIVRGADTGRPELAAQAPGLLSISLGLSLNYGNDLEMLEHGMVMYDALYAWCRRGKEEKHTWNPALSR